MSINLFLTVQYNVMSHTYRITCTCLCTCLCSCSCLISSRPCVRGIVRSTIWGVLPVLVPASVQVLMSMCYVLNCVFEAAIVSNSMASIILYKLMFFQIDTKCSLYGTLWFFCTQTYELTNLCVDSF